VQLTAATKTLLDSTEKTVTVLYGWRATRHRYVLAMITIVNTPSCVTTVRYRCLVAYAVYVVQQDITGPWPVLSSNYRASVSKTHTTQQHAYGPYSIVACVHMYILVQKLTLPKENAD